MKNTEISTAAAALGRKGGAAKSDAKTIAARANGAKGGRPRVMRGFTPAQAVIRQVSADAPSIAVQITKPGAPKIVKRFQIGAKTYRIEIRYIERNSKIGHEPRYFVLSNWAAPRFVCVHVGHVAFHHGLDSLEDALALAEKDANL